jgi:hypothetical protein
MAPGAIRSRQVVQAGDTEYRAMDAFAFEPAVTQDLPSLHPGEDVLNAGTDLLGSTIARHLPLGE